MDHLLYLIEDTLTGLLLIKDVTKPNGLLPFERRTFANIRRRVKVPETRTIKRINRAVVGMDPKSTSSVNRTVKVIEGELTKYSNIVAPLSSDEVFKGSEKTYKATKRRWSQKTGFPSSFIRPDEIAVGRVNKYQDIFIGDHYDDDVTRQVSRSIRKTVRESGGTLSRRQIAADLTKKMPGYVQQKGYFQVVTAQVLNNARSYSSARFYSEAAIDRFQVLAVLDERTSKQCEFMDGQILEVSKTLKQYEKYDEATTIDEVKEVNPWIDLSKGVLSVGGKILTPDMTGEDLQGMGLNAPPYHGRCRTTVTPVF